MVGRFHSISHFNCG